MMNSERAARPLGARWSSLIVGQRPIYLFGPLLLILVHFGFLMCFFTPAISTPDANSYFDQARTLAVGGVTSITTESPIQYVGTHYSRAGDERYFCAHAPGLAAILAVPYRLFGPSSAFLVNPLMCSLSLLGLFLLGRRWCGERFAPLAVALMAVNPFFNEHAHFGDAHAAVACLMIWSLYFLARIEGRPSIAAGLAGGFFAGMIPAVRYAEALYLPALACFVLSRRRRDGSELKALVSAAAAASLPIAALCLRNQGAYGAFWRTGYAAAGGGAFFSTDAFLRNAPSFLRQLVGLGGGLTFPLGAAAIVLMCARRSTRKRGLLFAGIAAPTTLLYMSYYWPADPQSMRFLIPTFFLYALGTAWLLRLSARFFKFRVRLAAAMLLFLQACWGLPRSVRAMGMLQRQTMPLASAGDALNNLVPPGSLLIVPERLAQYLDVLGRWRLVDSSLADEDAKLMPPPPPPFSPDEPMPLYAGRPSRFPGSFAAPLMPAARVDRYAGLSEEARFAAFRPDVWSWAGRTRKVYWVMTSPELRATQEYLSKGESLRIVERLNIAGVFAFRRPSRQRPRPEPSDLDEVLRDSRDDGILILVEWIRSDASK